MVMLHAVTMRLMKPLVSSAHAQDVAVEELSIQMALLTGAGIEIKEEFDDLNPSPDGEASVESPRKGRKNILGTKTTALTRRDTLPDSLTAALAVI